MNGAFIHIALNHIPVVGLPFAFLLLLVGVARKSRDLQLGALWGLVGIALVSILVFLSGARAEAVLQNYSGFSQQQIEAHEEAAEAAFTAIEILGGAALLGIWLVMRPKRFTHAAVLLILIASGLTSGWVGWTAHLGGLVHHPEIALAVRFE